MTLTVESGIYGGLPLGGVDFGIAKNCYALVRHDDQFDFYNGAGVDVTFMGAGEVDKDGNVNATRLGPNPTGGRRFCGYHHQCQACGFLFDVYRQRSGLLI